MSSITVRYWIQLLLTEQFLTLPIRPNSSLPVAVFTLYHFLHVTLYELISRCAIFVSRPPGGSRQTAYIFVQYLLFIGLRPTIQDNGSQPSLNRSPRNFHTCLVWDQPLNHTFENFSPSLIS